MIRRELFRKNEIKAATVAAILSASAVMGGCASQESTPVAATVQTTSVLLETESVVEAQSEVIPEDSEPEKDGEAPVITVSNARIEVVEGTDINLMDGVSASDENDGDLTGKIGVSEYDTSVLDVDQAVTYTVSDEAGNEASATAILLIKSNPIEALDKDMYTTSSVNVRSASSQDGEKLGSLPYVQSVHVTGQDKNTGWYEIEYNNGVGYVSDSYLSDTKPAPKPAPSTTNKGATNNGTSGGSKSDSLSSGGGSSAPQTQPTTPAPTPDPTPSSSSDPLDFGNGHRLNPPGSIDEKIKNGDYDMTPEQIEKGW